MSVLMDFSGSEEEQESQQFAFRVRRHGNWFIGV